jgi:RNA polymerase sigma factor (sigma-70 family)
MVDDDLTTTIQFWLDQLRAGDASARERLLECAVERMTHIARCMLRKDFERVARFEQTGDVLGEAQLQLDDALKTHVPSNPLEFYYLASAITRRQLIAMARHYYGPHGWGRNYESRGGRANFDGEAVPPPEPADETHEPSNLAAWTEFHRKVEDLPPELREVTDLMYYQSKTKAETARLLDVSEKTIQRRWRAAREALGAILADHFGL